ncbi:MAG: dienelactone hydrolase family protein [Planctomycetota bacterium]
MADNDATTKAQVRSVEIPAGEVTLPGDLAVVPDALGIVVFAHGSGSSRFSPRNRFVAEVLQDAHIATLLMDLLTTDEETVDNRTARLRFDIPMLADRVVAAADWAKREADLHGLPVGLFGASTGAAAALVAAAQRPETVAAVVSRGGRPDLAGDALKAVCAPTLMIVGGDDTPVIEMNQSAMDKMQADTRLDIVPGATHLFSEPGALERVAHLAGEWFDQCFRR